MIHICPGWLQMNWSGRPRHRKVEFDETEPSTTARSLFREQSFWKIVAPMKCRGLTIDIRIIKSDIPTWPAGGAVVGRFTPGSSSASRLSFHGPAREQSLDLQIPNH